jgi:hypothetical protein
MQCRSASKIRAIFASDSRLDEDDICLSPRALQKALGRDRKQNVVRFRQGQRLNGGLCDA